MAAVAELGLFGDMNTNMQMHEDLIVSFQFTKTEMLVAAAAAVVAVIAFIAFVRRHQRQ